MIAAAASRAGALAWALLLLGLLRGGVLVTAEPFTAYANQYDMTRTSACLDLWPAGSGEAPRIRQPQEPQADYRYVATDWSRSACYPSTIVALAALGLALDRTAEWMKGRDARDFDLRQLGLLQWLMLGAVALWLQVRLRVAPGAALLHAIVVAGVLADPFNTLFAGTLYTEFAALLAGYVAFSLFWSMLQAPRVGWITALAFALALVALGTSRMQHLLLPLLLAGVASITLRHRLRPAQMGLWLAVALLVPVGQWAMQSRLHSVADANRLNTFTGAVLPASADPLAMAQRLGLPARCGTLEHVNWYLAQGRDALSECPQLREVSRGRALAALVVEPRAAAVLLARGLSLSSDWRMSYVGERAGGEYLRIDGTLGLAGWTLAAPLSRAGLALHVALWLVPLLFGLPALWRWLRGGAGALDALRIAALGVVSAGLLTTLLGDGLIEVARHLHLALNALLLSWLLLFAQAVQRLREGRWRSIAAAVGFGLALTLGGLPAQATLPLAYGQVETPDGLPPASGPYRVAGWVLDPNGPDRVELRLADGRRVLATLRDDPVLQRLFPLDGARRAKRFEIWLEPPPVPDRDGHIFTVISVSGAVETRIARRDLPRP